MSKKTAKPIKTIPFTLHNIGDFLAEPYPYLHPKSKAYNDYWDKRTEECIYGIWGNDSRIKEGKKIGGYRWLPGNMGFYFKHTIIDKEIKGQKNKGDAPPDVRAVDLFIGYDLATCDGFAGFEFDKHMTCFRPIDKIERGEKLTPSEEILLERNIDHVLMANGKYKKYVDARIYLYNTFDEPLGNPLWLNESQNYMLLSTRRLGKSYIVINGVTIYNMTFNGAKSLDEFFQQKSKTTTVVGSGNSDKTKEFFAKYVNAYDYLRDSVGSYDDGRTKESGFWWWKTTGSTAENKYLTNQVPAEGRGAGMTGPGSRLWHVTYGGGYSKGAGFSCNDAIVEETGLTPKIEDIHRENSPAQKNDYKFGKTIYIGTGGDFEIIEGSKKMFHNPQAFDLLPCKNIWVSGGKDTARFIPATYHLNQFLDENGNLTDEGLKKSFIQIMHERDQKERLDTKQYLGHKASYPLVPDEIFVKYDGNSYPIKNLENRFQELKNNDITYSVGNIVFDDIRNTKGYWEEDFDATPLMNLDDLGDDNINKQGAIVQYEPPNKDRPKRKYFDRNPMYLVFAEPVRNDRGSSFVYVYVWKFWDYANPERMQNNIVMEWFGRFDNDNTKNLRRIFDIAAYYDANIYSEINNDEIKRVARNMKRFDWLIPDLGHIEGLEVNSKKENDIGKYVNPGEIPGLEKMVNEFLRQVVSFVEKIVGSELIRENTLLADTLNSQMLCSQLIAYNREGNYDAHDGFRLLPLWNKANEGLKVDEQFSESEKDKELLKVMRELRRSRNLRRKTAY